jgi:hypothetical protein
MIERYRALELGTVEERARVFPHLVGEQERNPQLNAAIRAGIERLRSGFETLARAAQERGSSTRRSSPDTSPGSASHSCKAPCSRSASTATRSTSTATPAPRPR